MINPEEWRFILFYVIFFVFVLLEQYFQMIIDLYHERKNKKNRIKPSEPDWDWLLGLESEPIEVTFDNRTFLVYDTETERWNLEIREPKIESEHSRMDRMAIEQALNVIRENETFNVYETNEFEIRGIPRIGHRSPSFKSIHKRTEIKIDYEDDYEE